MKPEMFCKLQNRIERILAHDKLLHYFFGSVIAFVAALASHFWLFPSYIVLVLPLVAGIIKEFIDVYLRHMRFSILDVIWTVTGSLFIYFLV